MTLVKNLSAHLTMLAALLVVSAVVVIGSVETLESRPEAPRSGSVGTWRFPDNDEVLARAATKPGLEVGAVAQAVAIGGRQPEDVWVKAGCVACHNPASGPFYKNLVAGRQASSAAALAAWIRNPQRFKPATAMPNLSAMVSEDEAEALGKWIKAGNPVGPIPADLPTPVPLPTN